MLEPAIALVETNSIAAGILSGDTMVKKAVVQLLEARSICPGKYMVLIGGEIGPVRESFQVGVAAAGERGGERKGKQGQAETSEHGKPLGL